MDVEGEKNRLVRTDHSPLWYSLAERNPEQPCGDHHSHARRNALEELPLEGKGVRTPRRLSGKTSMMLGNVALETSMLYLLNLLIAILSWDTFSMPTFTSEKMKNFRLLLQTAVYLRTE